jgi:hypothetical protein
VDFSHNSIVDEETTHRYRGINAIYVAVAGIFQLHHLFLASFCKDQRRAQ